MDSILSFLVPIILVVLVLLVLAANVRVVPQSRAFVIERGGFSPPARHHQGQCYHAERYGDLFPDHRP